MNTPCVGCHGDLQHPCPLLNRCQRYGVPSGSHIASGAGSVNNFASHHPLPTIPSSPMPGQPSPVDHMIPIGQGRHGVPLQNLGSGSYMDQNMNVLGSSAPPRGPQGTHVNRSQQSRRGRPQNVGEWRGRHGHNARGGASVPNSASQSTFGRYGGRYGGRFSQQPYHGSFRACHATEQGRRWDNVGVARERGPPGRPGRGRKASAHEWMPSRNVRQRFDGDRRGHGHRFPQDGTTLASRLSSKVPASTVGGQHVSYT